MSATMVNKIILTGSCIGWLHKIDEAAKTIVESYRFDNLQSSTYKLLKASSESSSSGDKLEINRADTGVIQFPKPTLNIDPLTELAIVSSTGGSDATSKGEITLVTNEAPIESNSWTAFIKSLQGNMSAKFLITIGTGQSYKTLNDSASKKPDGFVHMIGILTTDIEQQLQNGAVTLSMTFASQKIATDATVKTALTNASLFTAIEWKRGLATGNPTVKPATIISADADTIIAGDILVLPNITY